MLRVLRVRCIYSVAKATGVAAPRKRRPTVTVELDLRTWTSYECSDTCSLSGKLPVPSAMPCYMRSVMVDTFGVSQHATHYTSNGGRYENYVAVIYAMLLRYTTATPAQRVSNIMRDVTQRLCITKIPLLKIAVSRVPKSCPRVRGLSRSPARFPVPDDSYLSHMLVPDVLPSSYTLGQLNTPFNSGELPVSRRCPSVLSSAGRRAALV